MGLGVVILTVFMVLLMLQFKGGSPVRGQAGPVTYKHRDEPSTSIPPAPRRQYLHSPPSSDGNPHQGNTYVIGSTPVGNSPSTAASSSATPAYSPSAPPASHLRTDSLDYARTYYVSIAGRWFGGKHHWAAGLFECPSGCRINFVHDGEEEKQDAILIHGQAGDLPTSAGWMRKSSSIRAVRLLLYYAAENFEQMDSSQFLSQFNGEMSYRMRSVAREVQYPLEAVGRFERVSPEFIGDVHDDGFMQKTWADVMADPMVPVEQKNRIDDLTICWASNHCSSTSGREDYVRQLLQHIPVEVFTAPCLKNASPEHQNMEWKEQRNLWRRYKFYLAFENTRCNDYVTEKFYLALIRGQVPVVIGAANTAIHAPSKDSYIDTRDFSSPKALADYLRYLDTNNTAYMQYFQWHSRPFSSYGEGFRTVIEDALPVAQVYGSSAGQSGGAMFACATCHSIAKWHAAGRSLDGVVEPFQCDGPIRQQADGNWT